MCHFHPVRFAKSDPSQSFCCVLCGLKGMHLDMQVMSQACQSIVTHQEGKVNVTAPIISSMDRGTHCNVSFLSCAFLPNLPKTIPSSGHCEA